MDRLRIAGAIQAMTVLCDNGQTVLYLYLGKQEKRTLYIGVTSDLPKRIFEHKQNVHDGFTEKYNVKNLVHYEVFADPENAIHREKRLKKYKREAKIKLIEQENPHWLDLYEKICQ